MMTRTVTTPWWSTLRTEAMAEEKKQIGKYDILGVLGKGAMGLVYRGVHRDLGRQVALKVITGAEITEEMKERFIHEARAVAKIDHPNIVGVYDMDRDEDGQPYIAMELLKGEDLKDVMQRRQTLPVDEAVDVIAQVCEGLSYAHEHKITHRDIKPANIHVSEDGRIKVMDFGVAKMDSTSLTKTGMVIGTPDYMSPEQIQGKPVDTRSDIFSTGVVFYEILTRSKPFTADSITSVIYNVVFKQPPSFADLDLQVPPEIERIIHKAMAKELEDRYTDIADMARDLRAFQSGKPGAHVSAVDSTADDATTELSQAEIDDATRQGMAGAGAGGAGTQQVAESPDARKAAAGGAGAQTVVGAPKGGAIGAAPGEARPSASKLPMIIGGAVLLVLVAAVGSQLLGGGDDAGGVAGGAVVSTDPVAVELTLVPWARIERLERVSANGKREDVAVMQAVTPTRLMLSPGQYEMSVTNSELGLKESMSFRVDAGGSKISRRLKGFEPSLALGAVLAGGS